MSIVHFTISCHTSHELSYHWDGHTMLCISNNDKTGCVNLWEKLADRTQVMNYTLPNTRIFGQHICCRHYGSTGTASVCLMYSWLWKLMLWVWCKAYFNILNHSGTNHECDRQRDGRTDIPVANAVPHYTTTTLHCVANN